MNTNSVSVSGVSYSTVLFLKFSKRFYDESGLLFEFMGIAIYQPPLRENEFKIELPHSQVINPRKLQKVAQLSFAFIGD